MYANVSKRSDATPDLKLYYNPLHRHGNKTHIYIYIYNIQVLYVYIYCMCHEYC